MVDQNFINGFQKQIDVLKKLEASVGKAIETANGQIKDLKDGKSMEHVFPPALSKQSPAAQSGDRKGHR
jgi:hypothetical protein